MPLFRAAGVTGSFVAGQVLYGVGTHSSLPVKAKGSGAGTAGAGSGTFGLFFRDSTPQLGISTPAVVLSGSNNAIFWGGDPGETDESFLIVTNYNGTTTTMDAELGYKDNVAGAEPNWTSGKHVFLGPCVAIPLQFRTSNVGRMLIDASGNVAIGPGSLTASAKFHVQGAGSSIALFQTSGAVATLEIQSTGRADFNRTGGSNAVFTCSSTGAANIFTKNSDVTGGTGIEFQENTGVTTKLAIGYGNASYTDAKRTGRPFLWVGSGAVFVVTDSTRDYISIDQAAGSIGIQMDSAAKIGFFGATAVVKQASGANLTNNMTSGGTTDQIDTWTNLATYSTDAAAIRNAVYQLARKLKQVNDALRLYGLLT